MTKFIEFQKFPDMQDASELLTLLKNNNIPYQIDDSGQRFSLVSNPLDNFVVVKIQEENIQKTNELLSIKEDKDFEKIEDDHYLYTFSDEDIIDAIANQSEWSNLEIKIANKIAKERNLELTAETLNKAKRKKLKEIVNEEQKSKNKIKNTANWFGAIAIFSVINSILLSMQIDWHMLFGLGITQVADGIIYRLTGEFGIYNIISSISLSLIFVLFWYFARKEQKWAFIVGIIFYSIDALLFLFVKDWLSVGFHIFVIIGILSGYLDLLEFKNKQKEEN
jgi:hypothetical protein